MNQNKKNVLNPKSKDEPINWSKSEIKIAVLAAIIKKSRKLNQTIAAASIQQIKNELKRHYNKDLTPRYILDVIQSLGKLVVKEKDPRNGRRSLYRINPKLVKEATITLVKLNNEKADKNNDFEGVLCCPLLSTEKKTFLAIGHKH